MKKKVGLIIYTRFPPPRFRNPGYATECTAQGIFVHTHAEIDNLCCNVVLTISIGAAIVR